MIGGVVGRTLDRDVERDAGGEGDGLQVEGRWHGLLLKAYG